MVHLQDSAIVSQQKEPIIMPEELLKIYLDEIQFLLRLKESIGKLNNRIHDKLALIAIEKLKLLHPNVSLEYDNAGAAGIDIQGYDNNRSLRLVAEVKTTLTSSTGSLRGPQKQAIKNDLERLSNQNPTIIKYFIVLSRQTKEAIVRQLNSSVDFPQVKILDVLENIPFVDTESLDE